MRNFISLFIILSGVFCSCTNHTKSNRASFAKESFISIDLEKNKEVSVYDFFSEVEIIPLETTSNSLLTFLMGTPDRVVLNEGKYYFMDDKQQAIIIFNDDGTFLNKMDYKGMGPGEYISVRDFNINRFTGNIEILSPEGRYINIYDASGKTFIERLYFPSDMPVVHLFHHLSADIYVLLSCAGSIEMLFYSRKDNQFVRNNYNLPEWIIRTVYRPSKNPFYVYNDTLCFKQNYNGDVFTVSPFDYELKPRYCWDFGKNNFDLLSTFPEDESINFYMDLSKRISMNYAVLFLIYKENTMYYMTRFKF